MDQVWAREHVLNTLKRRALAGEPPVSVTELQGLAGMGPGDLTMALGLLVEEGKAIQVAEGAVPVYALAGLGDGAAEAPGVGGAAEVAADAPLIGVGESTTAPTMVQIARELHEHEARVARPVSIEPRTMSMSAAAAQALHPDSLGALIMAGLLEAAEAGVTFTFTVTP